MNDGFVVDSVVHPHDEGEHKSHSVWVEKIADNQHTYELRMEDGDYIVKLDGKVVPDNLIKDKGSVIILMDKSGEVLYEFQTDRSVDHHVSGTARTPMVIRTKRTGNHLFPGDSNVSFGVTTDIQKRPKVMLGIYTGEPGDSLRDHLGITGDAIVIESVIKGLAADKAGLKDNDIILSINGSEGISSDGLTEFLSDQDPDDEIKMVILRKGEKLKINAKLLAYDSKALGRSPISGGATWIGQDGTGSMTFAPGANRFFSKENQQLAHEKVLEALREEGISEQKIRKIKEQIGAALHENVWSQFDNGEFDGIIDLHVEAENQAQSREHFRFAEQMQRKAESAMRDAERLTMEYKDGQLLLKRHAQGLEEDLTLLKEQLHESMPVIEEELHGRLEELEGRLDELESMLDERMDSLSGLIERLIDRLDED